ncbi:hypothetical protein CS379_22915 [Methylobacterium frigidaeris]|nr:hypothetical protein CS379_22915 [Methylobacterium frigidaeris]
MKRDIPTSSDRCKLSRSGRFHTASIINGNYALEAGLTPAKDALALEKAENNPYANIFVTTQALAKDPRVQRLSVLLASPEVATFIREKYRGSVVPVHGG